MPEGRGEAWGPHLRRRCPGIVVSVKRLSPLAALLAFAVAKGLNDKFITETAAKYSLPPESLSADKYLID